MNSDNNIFADCRTTLMIIMAMRYAQDRHTAAPSTLVDWIKQYWEFIDSQTQSQIKKEMRKFLQRPLAGRVDRTTWEDFQYWLMEQ